MSTTAKGFTLIEIMIAISIVAVTFGVIISSAAQVRKTGRDAQKQADLQAVQAALQQYYADQNYYPDKIDFTSGAPITNCPSVPAAVGCQITKTYLNKTPISPTGLSTDYMYRSGIDSTASNRTSNCDVVPINSSMQCHFYILCAKLEGASPQSNSQYSDCSPWSKNYQLNP